MPDNEPYHTVEFTVGIKAIRDRDDHIKGVKGTTLWQELPNHIAKDERLLRVTVEIPESFFAVTAKVKGRIESRLEEEFAVLLEELE